MVHIKRSQQPVRVVHIFEFSKTKHNYKLKRELYSRFKIQTQALFLDAVLLYAEIDLRAHGSTPDLRTLDGLTEFKRSLNIHFRFRFASVKI